MGEKNKHFKVVGFSTIFGEAETHTIPKILKKWIPIVKEKYGKTQTFQSNGFLKYFGWCRNPYNSKIWAKWIYIVQEKYGKTQKFRIVFAAFQI